jgi:hypothetical protein
MNRTRFFRLAGYFLVFLLILSGILLFGFVVFIASIVGISDCGNTCQGLFFGFISYLFTNHYFAGFFGASIALLIAGTTLAIPFRQKYSESMQKSSEYHPEIQPNK